MVALAPEPLETICSRGRLAVKEAEGETVEGGHPELFIASCPTEKPPRDRQFIKEKVVLQETQTEQADPTHTDRITIHICKSDTPTNEV